MMVELSQPGVNVRYGRHDRYGIPLDHPEARRFYLDHLFVPHSRREMIWAAVARASSSAGRVILIREPGRGFPPELNKQECLSHVEFLTGELEKHLRRPGTPVSGPLFALTLEDYPDSERQQKVLFLFSPSSSMPCAIAKVTAQSRHAVTLKAEYRTLQTLQVELDRDLRATIPRPLGYFEAGSFPVLAETFLPGHSIYFDLRNSWRPHRLAPGHFRLAHDWLVRFQRAMEPEGRSLDKEMIGEYVACPLERFQRAFELSASERNLIDQVMGSARRLQGEHLSIVAQQGDFWARNLILNDGTIGVTDWEEFKTRSPPFSDLFLFATSYGLSFPWKLGRWTEPAVAFRATYFAVTWLARLVREFFLTYCQTMETTPRLLGIFFPVFLAEQALEQRGKSGARAWRNLFHFYAQREGPACFD